MLKFQLFCSILLLFIFFPSSSSHAELKNNHFIKIAIINSYDYDHICTAPQINGILKEIRKHHENITFDIESYYMQARTKNNTEIKRDNISKLIIEDVNKNKPDYIITTDDIAFEKCGIPLSEQYKIFFSGLNKPFSEYNIKNVCNFAGVEERISLENVFRIFDNIRFMPNEMIIIKDRSVTGYYMAKNYYEEIKNRSNFKIKEYQIEYVYQLRKIIRDLQSNPKSVIILAFQQLKDEYENSISKQNVVNELLYYNKKHLELGGNYLYSQFGISISCAPSFEKMGQLIGEMIIETIKTDTFKPKIKHPVNFISINIQRLSKLGFKDIYEESIETVDKSYHSYGDY
jgi:hypothetical protein